MAGNITIDPNVPDAPVNITTDVPNAPASVNPRDIATFNQPSQPAPAPQVQTVPMFGPDNEIYDVPADKSKDALAAGGSVASPIIAPDGSHMFVPASKLHDALKAGAKIDDTGWTPAQEKLNHPSIAQRSLNVVAGPGTVGEDVVDRWKNPRPVNATNPIATHEELSKPLASFANAMTPEEQKAHPVLAETLNTAGGLTSPENIAIMIASEGMGALSGPESMLASKVFPRLVSGGFSAVQVIDAAKSSPELLDAIKRGDESEALRLTTRIVEQLGMAALGAQHAAGVEATPSTGVGKAAQTAVDHGVFRTQQAFRSDARAMSAATAAHRGSMAIFDQRLNEHEIAVDQAVRASQAADEAKVKFANGEITAQQLDQANTVASQAAANAGKATKALVDARENLGTTGAEVDRLTRKSQKTAQKVNDRQTKAIAGAKEDFQKAIPSAPSGKAAYTDRDYEVARGYLEHHHQNIQEVGSVQDVYDAFDHTQKDIENQIAPYVQRYAREPISTNVRMDVRDALAENPRADFVEQGMRELENYNLIDPTIEEADTIRKQLNDENRAILSKNHWDIDTALGVDPTFAARYAAAESLRNGIYDTFEDKGVRGIRELRQDEASIIKLRNAAERQLVRADKRVRGSGESGNIRKAIGKYAAVTGTGLGAGIGAATGIPGAAEGGAIAGELAGKKLGKLIAPGDSTRDELAARSMKVKGGGVPITRIEGTPAPGSDLNIPSPVSPKMQLFTPQRENTPIHSALASYFGERFGESSYVDLEDRFLQGIQDKKAHGVPLESDEKKILTQINEADMKDRIAAQKQLQDLAVKGKTPPVANLPTSAEPLLRVAPSKMAEGMDTQRGIVHDLAHVVVGNERGIKFTDGIRSHLHPENVSDGSLMSAPMDWSPFLDQDGNVDSQKFKAKAADIAATYVAGGVANDLYHDIPFTENHHLGADVRFLKYAFKEAGFTEAEATKLIAQAADDAAQILGKPGVQDILEKHAAVREGGLDEQYHISPVRMEQILEDTKGAINEGTTGKSAGANETVHGADEGTRAATKNEPKEGDSTELRQEGKGPAEGKGRSVRENEPSGKPGTEAANTGAGTGLGTAPEEFKPIARPEGGWKKPIEPENPKLSEEDDFDQELQTPKKEAYQMTLLDKDGNSKDVEIHAFSPANAVKVARKLYPDMAAYTTEDFKPLPSSEEYSVPTGKPLSQPRSRTTNRTDIHVEKHELGHALVGMNEGHRVTGMLRHTHPDLPSTARAAVGWDRKSLIDPKTGRVFPEKVPGLIRVLMGGVAADEAFNDYPRGQNHNMVLTAGGDGTVAYQILRRQGLDHDAAVTALNTAIDQAKSYLTHPTVSGIIDENVGKREPDLSRQYHYSPDRLQSMHREIQRRMQNAGQSFDYGRTSEEGTPGRGGNVPGGEGEVAAGGAEGTAAEPAQGITPENPKMSGLREITTGDPDSDKVIKDAGGIPGGVMFPGTEFQIKMFHDPETRTTLGFRPTEQITPEAVKQKLSESRAVYGIQPQNPKLWELYT